MSTVVDIYNLALNAVGNDNLIALPTERSREAEVCNLWYEPVRDQILAAAAWPEATTFAYLALIDEQDDDVWAAGEARPGNQFYYSLPADCLRPQYLTNFSSFQLSLNGDTRALSTNTSEAILAYTARLEEVSLWGPELRMAISYGLASHICMPLTGKPTRAKVLIEQANNLIWAARESAANSQQETYDSLPDWIAARGYSGSTQTQRYIYPTGSLLSSSI